MTTPLRIHLRKFLPVLALGFLFVAACDDATAPIENARVEVRLTDNPSEILEFAEVTISAVYLQGGPGNDDSSDAGESDDADEPSGRTYLYEFDADEDAAPFTVNLLDLRDNASISLAAAEVEPGEYGQLRFVVEGSRVVLADGYTFEDGSIEREILIPSGSTSGIKVVLTNPIEATNGDTFEILVDFDVDEAFRFPGMGNGTTVREVIFLPVLRELSRTTEDGTDG